MWNLFLTKFVPKRYIDWLIDLIEFYALSAKFSNTFQLYSIFQQNWLQWVFCIEIYWNYFFYSYLYFNSGHTCKHYWNYRYWCDTKYQMAISNTNKVMASIFSPVNQSCTNVKFLFSLWYFAYTRIILLFYLFKLMYVNLSF